MARFVVDTSVALHLLEEGAQLPTAHQLLAPTLMRSHVLNALYTAVRRGELTRETALERLARFATWKIRYLGDKVLRNVAWKVAEEHGWESTLEAEYVALTQLQADAFITLDAGLEKEVAGIVATASIDALREAQFDAVVGSSRGAS